jgi:hypothetical protein
MTFAQNQVRNGSFEDLLACPGPFVINLNRAPPWFNPNLASPDLFHQCSTTPNFSVPNNWLGNQMPIHGLAYANILALYSNVNPEYTHVYEYISTPIELKDSGEYVLEFYLSLAENSYYYTNKVSVLFSEFPLPSNVYSYVDLTPTASFQLDWLDDYLGWQKISIPFLGKESYKYMTIGFFDNFQSIDKQPFTGNNLNTIIYYIDNVSISAVNFYKPISDTTLCRNNKLVLEAEYYPDMSYAWYCGNQWLSDSSTLYYDNPQEGWYVLYYTDFRGDTYQDSVYVTVESCPELWLPTWFAPSQSQYWHPHWRDIEYWEVTVYNSLGQVVHRYTGSPELHPGWDGYSMASGVYCAVVNARAFNGEQLRVVEKVMLLR